MANALRPSTSWRYSVRSLVGGIADSILGAVKELHAMMRLLNQRIIICDDFVFDSKVQDSRAVSGRVSLVQRLLQESVCWHLAVDTVGY